jgi:hypothetical protein
LALHANPNRGSVVPPLEPSTRGSAAPRNRGRHPWAPSLPCGVDSGLAWGPSIP